MWSPIQTVGRITDEDYDSREDAPMSRCKHATCTTPDGHIYLFGGRSGNLPLKDLWRLDPGQNTWEQVKCWGDNPPFLQEHTITSHNGKLYVFGGEIGFSCSTETPLWILDLGTCIWRKGCSGLKLRNHSSSTMLPSSRRGHTAVLFNNGIHIYGGYQDLKGSSSELWTFNLALEQWHLVSDSQRCSGQPSPRHSHSAVVHDSCMWIYGGMTDLREKGDLWKWNFDLKQWSRVKCSKGPGPLRGHSAVKAFGSMFVFGGERKGNLKQGLWRYYFKSNVWEKIIVDGLVANPRCRHTAVAIPSLENDENCLALTTHTYKSFKEKISLSRLARSISLLSNYGALNNSHSSNTSNQTDVPPKDGSDTTSMNSDKIHILSTCDLEDDDPVQCPVTFGSPMQKSHSSDPVLESECDPVIRRRIPGPSTWGQKIRPRSEVLDGLHHLESLLENSECDNGASALTDEKLKRHSIHESMSYYSLCFPSPPFERRVNSPHSNESTTPSGSSIAEEEKTNSSHINTNQSQANRPKDWPNIPPEADLENSQLSTLNSNGSSVCTNDSGTLSSKGLSSDAANQTSPERSNQGIFFDNNFYKAIHSSAADGQQGTNDYNSSATLCTPSSDSQGLPHSMSHSSGYHSFSDENTLESRESYNPFIYNSRSLNPANSQPSSSITQNFVPRRQIRLPREARSLNTMEMKLLSTNLPENGVRFDKDHVQLRSRPRVGGVFRNSGLRSSMNENKLWQQINVIKEVVVPSSPAARKWTYSPGKSRTHQHHWQLCMYIFGGYEKGSSGSSIYKQPISVWKFYI